MCTRQTVSKSGLHKAQHNLRTLEALLPGANGVPTPQLLDCVDDAHGNLAILWKNNGKQI